MHSHFAAHNGASLMSADCNSSMRVEDLGLAQKKRRHYRTK